MSKRQVELAKELGIEGVDNMSPREITFAIADAPATEAQLTFVKALTAYQGLQLPDVEMTYGTASKILDNLTPLVCDNVLMDKKWNEGDIVEWKGVTYEICIIHTDKSFTLARVELKRQSDGKFSVKHTDDAREKRYPLTLAHDQAVKIDLETYQP